MESNLEKARHTLACGEYTCVVYDGVTTYTSHARGVKPLLNFIDAGTDLHGFSAADKVVGKATAFLYCLLGVKEVYAQIISEAARQVLTSYGIPVYWDQEVAFIRNRTNTGRCPMETATESVRKPEDALIAIRAALKKLQG